MRFKYFPQSNLIFRIAHSVCLLTTQAATKTTGDGSFLYGTLIRLHIRTQPAEPADRRIPQMMR